MKRIAFIIFLLSCMPFCVSAYDEVYADNDVEHSAGMRVGAYFFHRPIPELELILAEDIRMRDNFTKFDMFLTTAELSYLVNNYFKFGAAYSLLAYFRDGNSYSEYKSYWELRNRIYLHATGSVSETCVQDYGCNMRYGRNRLPRTCPLKCSTRLTARNKAAAIGSRLCNTK